MSETPPAKESLQACLGYMEDRLGVNEVEMARHNASYHDTWDSRSIRDDRYQYGSLSSTFREAFRHEAGVNPWGGIDWVLRDDDEYIDDFDSSRLKNNALIYSATLTRGTPSSVANEAFSLVASRVLSKYERKELYTQAAQERGLFRDEYWEEVRERVPGVGSMLRGASTAKDVTEILGPSRGPAVAISGIAVVLARALEVAQADVKEGRPDFGVTAVTSAVKPLLDLAQATGLLRRSIESSGTVGASEQREVEALVEKLDQYREYIWASVSSYDMLRAEHIAATNAIDADIAGLRKEDREWGDLVAAAGIIAAVEPPPSVPGEPRRAITGFPVNHSGGQDKHPRGCACRDCK